MAETTPQDPKLTPQQAAVVQAASGGNHMTALVLAAALSLMGGGGLGTFLSDRETAAELRVLGAKVDDQTRRIAGIEAEVKELQRGRWTRDDHEKYAESVSKQLGRLEDEVRALRAGGK